MQVFEEEQLADLTEAGRHAFFDWLERLSATWCVRRSCRIIPQSAIVRFAPCVSRVGQITLEDGSTWEVLSWYRTVTWKWKPGMRVSLEESPWHLVSSIRCWLPLRAPGAIVRPDSQSRANRLYLRGSTRGSVDGWSTRHVGTRSGGLILGFSPGSRTRPRDDPISGSTSPPPLSLASSPRLATLALKSSMTNVALVLYAVRSPAVAVGVDGRA